MKKKSYLQLQKLLGSNVAMQERFEQLRSEIMPIKPSQYDTTNLCNLSCVGCLYFDGDGAWQGDPEKSYKKWYELFLNERARGVNFPHFGGAEPSLNPEALKAAAAVFTRGVIYSNGSLLISKDIHFKIHISVWSDAESEQSLRGNQVFSKALKNYKNDSRAIIVFTLSSVSVTHIPAITKLCHENGVKLTFNYYSPPAKTPIKGKPFLRKIQIIEEIEPDTLALSVDQLKYAHETISELKSHEDYHQTIVFSADLAAKMETTTGLFNIDPETGFATDCASRLTNEMQHFTPDTKRAPNQKCCTPNIDCATCKLYSMSYASTIDHLDRHLESEKSLVSWLNILETWKEIFMVQKSESSLA